MLFQEVQAIHSKYLHQNIEKQNLRYLMDKWPVLECCSSFEYLKLLNIISNNLSWPLIQKQYYNCQLGQMSNLEEIQQPIQNPNNQSSKSINTGHLPQTSISHSFWGYILNKLMKIKISMITLLRLIILFTFFAIYSLYPFAASLLFMANFVLDYLYWAIVSQNGGGTILAECLDWIADILSALILPFFLYTIESQYLLFYLFFFCIKWWHFFAQLTGRQSQMNKLRKFKTSKNLFTKGHKEELKQNWYDMKNPNKKINHFISNISGLIRVNVSSFACNCLLFINYVPSLTRYLMCSSLTTKIRRTWRRQQKNRTQIKFSIKQISSQQ